MRLSTNAGALGQERLGLGAATSQTRRAEFRAVLSGALAALAAIQAAAALILWLLVGPYPQLLALIGVAGLMLGGVGSHVLLQRLGREQPGTVLLFALALGSLALAPLMAPIVTPSSVAMALALLIAGCAIFDARWGLGLVTIGFLVLGADLVLMPTWEPGLFADPLGETATLGLALAWNLPAVLGALFLGRQVTLKYEGALASERRLFRIVIDTLPDNIFVKDAASRIVIDNVAHARLLGDSTPDEVTGKSDFDFFPRELAQKYRDDELAILQSGEAKINIEEPTVDPEGHTHWLLTTKVPLRDSAGTAVGIVGINRDITTRRAAEQERDRLMGVEREQRGHLENLVAQIREAAERLKAAAAEILAASTQQAASVTEQDTAVTQTMATLEEVQTTVKQTAERTQEVATAAHQSADVSRAGQNAVEDSIAGMDAIRARVEDIAETILALSERTQQIGEIIETVNEIADQSKLLALNASIEAARAGEEGKGFAVVAMEVRQLAEQSRAATARVRDILLEVQQATNTAVMVTEDGSKEAARGMALVERAGEAIRDLAGTIETAAQAATQIAASTQQQMHGMDQLLSAMHAIEQASGQSAESARQTERSAQDLHELARAMEALVAHDQLSLS